MQRFEAHVSHDFAVETMNGDSARGRAGRRRAGDQTKAGGAPILRRLSLNQICKCSLAHPGGRGQRRGDGLKPQSGREQRVIQPRHVRTIACVAFRRKFAPAQWAVHVAAHD